MAAAPRVFVLSATARPDAPDTSLALEIARQVALAGGEASVATLADYSLPPFDALAGGDESLPQAARQLAERLALEDGLVLVGPLHNGSLAAMAKNAVDWIASAGLGAGHRDAPFKGLLVALATAEGEADGEALWTAWQPVVEALAARPLEPALVSPFPLPDEGESVQAFAAEIVARAGAEGRRVY